MLMEARRDFISKIIVFILGIILMAKVFLPLLSLGISENSKYIFLQVLGKSNGSLEQHIAKSDHHEDEENIELTSYIIKNMTGIDLSNPTKLLSSQMPLLGLVDIDKIKGEQKESIIIENTPKEEPVKKEEPKTQEAKGNEVKPNENKTVSTKKLDPKKPEVLIYHTHTTEGYNPTNAAGQNYTNDLSKTVARVGDELKKELEEKYGIATVHDKTIHDVKRAGAYAKSRPTIQKYIKDYSEYKIIIDLHRDGLDVDKNGEFTKKTTAVINGEKYSRTMFVLGNKNKNLKQSEAMAKKLENEINKMYPKFSRGIIYKDKSVFNQDLSDKIVLIEVGSQGNSLEESLRTAKLIAKVLANSIDK